MSSINTSKERKRKFSADSMIRKNKSRSAKIRKRIITPILFPISDRSIQEFRRMIKKPKDCVINALELIGLLDGVNADLMRIVIGDTGITAPQILSIFHYIYPQYQSSLMECRLREIRSFCETELPPSTAIFCGYMDQTNHIFLIGKTLQGRIVFMDPQQNIICYQDDTVCSTLFSHKKKYVILA